MTLKDSLSNLPEEEMSDFLREMLLKELRQALAWEQENLEEAQKQTKAEQRAYEEADASGEIGGVLGLGLYVGQCELRVKRVIGRIEEEIKRREIRVKYLSGEHLPQLREAKLAQMEASSGANSGFWRDLEARFRAIPDPHGMLCADRDYILGSGEPGEWRLCGIGDQSVIRRFETLAKLAGTALDDPVISDPLVAWLDRLMREGANFRIGPGPYYAIEVDEDGTQGAHHLYGAIERLCEASADYCSVLESRAFQARQTTGVEHVPSATLSDSAQAGVTAPKPNVGESAQESSFQGFAEGAMAELPGLHPNDPQNNPSDTVGRKTRLRLKQEVQSQRLERKLKRVECYRKAYDIYAEELLGREKSLDDSFFEDFIPQLVFRAAIEFRWISLTGPQSNPVREAGPPGRWRIRGYTEGTDAWIDRSRTENWLGRSRQSVTAEPESKENWAGLELRRGTEARFKGFLRGRIEYWQATMIEGGGVKEIDQPRALRDLPLKSRRGRKKGGARETQELDDAIRDAKRDGSRKTIAIVDCLVRRGGVLLNPVPLPANWRNKYGVKDWKEVRSRIEHNRKDLLVLCRKRFSRVKA